MTRKKYAYIEEEGIATDDTGVLFFSSLSFLQRSKDGGRGVGCSWPEGSFVKPRFSSFPIFQSIPLLTDFLIPLCRNRPEVQAKT